MVQTVSTILHFKYLCTWTSSSVPPLTHTFVLKEVHCTSVIPSGCSLWLSFFLPHQCFLVRCSCVKGWLYCFRWATDCLALSLARLMLLLVDVSCRTLPLFRVSCREDSITMSILAFIPFFILVDMLEKRLWCFPFLGLFSDNFEFSLEPEVAKPITELFWQFLPRYFSFSGTFWRVIFTSLDTCSYN